MRFSYRRITLIAIPAFLLLGAGCSSSQNITANGVENANKVENANDGSKDNAVNTKDDSGSSVGGGEDRPASAPDDLPSLPGAREFTWLGGAGSGMFAYELAGNDYKKMCASQIDLLLNAGWEKSNDYEVAVEKMMTESFIKPGFSLSLTCSDSTDDNSNDYKTGIVLTKTNK